jgi:hypothetical protein
MHIASLSALWLGLTLPAILLMYLLKRKYIDTVVPSSLLWNRVLKETEATRPWQRLRRNLLLILQLIAAACLVFAAMQPYVLADSQAKGHIVVVLDRSASMASLANDPYPDADTNTGTGMGTGTPIDPNQAALTRLEQAKQGLLADLEKRASGSRITLITLGSQPQIVLTRESDSAKITAAISGLSPDYGTAAYQETLSLAAALTSTDADAEIVIWTDSQWAQDAGGISFQVPVLVKTVGDGSTGNITIAEFGVRTEVVPTDSNGSTTSDSSGSATGNQTEGADTSRLAAIASIKNWGTVAREISITLYAERTATDFRTLTLQPGGQQTVSFSGLPASDYYKVSIDTPDVYAPDNQAYAFAADNQPRTAILVTEGNLFLEKALQLAQVSVVKASPDSAAPTLQKQPDLVIIDSGAEGKAVGADWTKLLDGKPQWVLNSGAGEAELTGTNYTITTHPVTEHIGLTDTHIGAARKLTLPAWAQPLVKQGETVLLAAGLDDGVPRLLFGFDLHQSDLPLRPEFPILVQNAVDWLSERGATGLGRALAGSTLPLSVSPKTVTAEWQRLELDVETGATATAIPSTYPAEKGNGRIAAMQTVPPLPGLYRWVESGAGDERTIRYLEVIADPAEANPLTKPAMNWGTPGGATPQDGSWQAATPLPGQTASSPSVPGVEQPTVEERPTGNLPGEASVALLRWLALAALLIIFIEWGVYRRGNSL